MRLLRVGVLGKEKPAALDKNGNIRDLSQEVLDFNPDTLNFETLDKLKKINLERLCQKYPSSTRIGSCISVNLENF